MVFNVASGGQVAFNGSIVLSGGITSDHILFNITGAGYDIVYANLTGGPKLNLTANGSAGPPNPPKGHSRIRLEASISTIGSLMDGSSPVTARIRPLFPAVYRCSGGP